MKTIFLNVASAKHPHCPIWISDNPPCTSSPESSQIVRSSPLYCIDQTDGNTVIPLSESAPHVWFGCTLRSFKCIAELKRKTPGLVSRLYTSHGFASVILFYKEASDISAVREAIGSELIAEEKWIIEAGALKKSEPVSHIQCEPYSIDLYLADHLVEDHAIVRELQSTLFNVYPQLKALSPAHRQMADSAATMARQISISILYLQDRINDNVLKTRINEIFRGEQDIAARVISQLSKEKSNSTSATVALHQYRDEAIQIGAILQSVFQQGLCGLPPLLNSPHQPGTFSLLGIAGVYAALVALYARVRTVFVTVQPDRIVEEMFPTWKAPALPIQPQRYEEWRSTLKDYSNAKTSLPEYPEVRSVFHLLYFSNRLGFRATKLSITAAYQSIVLGLMPSWNVSTIFHEFLHAHVKSLLADVFPSEDDTFKEAYAIYKSRRPKPEGAKGLIQFMQALILHVASDLSMDDQGQKNGDIPVVDVLPHEQLKKAVMRHYDPIDELFVHILDLNYFYESDTDIYIKSIWSSWLTLPFIMDRIGEYALRTICAVASVEDGRRIDRFNLALNRLRNQLNALKTYDFTNQQLVEDVLTYLAEKKNVDVIRAKFFIYAPLFDAIVEFFVFPTLQPQLFREVSDVLQEDDTYSYGLQHGEYQSVEIESGAKFIMDQLKQSLSGWSAKSKSESEYLTLWSFQVIASTLSKNNHEKT